MEYDEFSTQQMPQRQQRLVSFLHSPRTNTDRTGMATYSHNRVLAKSYQLQPAEKTIKETFRPSLFRPAQRRQWMRNVV